MQNLQIEGSISLYEDERFNRATTGCSRHIQTTPGRPQNARTIDVAHALRSSAPHMQPSESDRGHDDALARRAEDLQSLREAEQATALTGDQREVTGEISLVRQHPADVADFTYQRELQQTTHQLLDRQTAQVEAAMRARDRGTYGVCQECGQGIPPERLQARPEATLCVDCQRRLETGRVS